MSTCLTRLSTNEASVIGHETIDLMDAHRVPPSAQNYEVWLSYRLGVIADLRREIDDRVATKAPFDDTFNQTIHDRFFSSGQLNQQMAEAGERIAQELSTVLTAVASAGDHAKEYAGDLEAAASILSKPLAPEMLRRVIGSMASATVKMLHQNKELSDQLQSSGRQLDTMRKTLKQARTEAMTDGLTGLANRRLFDETLRSRLREFATAFGPFTLALLDIDHFKRFNDTWGHPTGDQIIRFVASTLQRLAPANGLAARFGGEEFALIMPSVDIAEARIICEQVRTAIESKSLMRKSTGEDLGRITISSGIALLRVSDTPASLIERADSCLYASKGAGRNCVTAETDRQASFAA